MSLRWYSLCLGILFAAGSMAGGEARAGFLPPELDSSIGLAKQSAGAAETSTRPSEPCRVPQQAPAERFDVAVPSNSSLSGTGTASIVLVGGGQAPATSHVEIAGQTGMTLRLAFARERVRPCRGFVPQLLRPPKV
jgi:hypothetical protein